MKAAAVDDISIQKILSLLTRYNININSVFPTELLEL